MKILTTIKPRNQGVSTHSYGVLAEIDWARKKIVRKIKIPSASFFDENSFSHCALNGLAVYEDRIFVSAWNFLIEIDYASFEITNCISIPLMGDLHSIAINRSKIFVVSTVLDAILCFNLNNLEYLWYWRPNDDYSTRSQLSLENSRDFIPKINRSKEFRYVHKSRSSYYRHHLNDCRVHKDQLYISAKDWCREANCSTIIRLNLATLESDIVVEPGVLRGAHDPVIVGNSLYATESESGLVSWFDQTNYQNKRSIRPSKQKYFVRGLEYVNSGFLLGLSSHKEESHPAKIIKFNEGFTSQLSYFKLDEFYDSSGSIISSIKLSPT